MFGCEYQSSQPSTGTFWVFSDVIAWTADNGDWVEWNRTGCLTCQDVCVRYSHTRWVLFQNSVSYKLTAFLILLKNTKPILKEYPGKFLSLPLHWDFDSVCTVRSRTRTRKNIGDFAIFASCWKGVIKLGVDPNAKPFHSSAQDQLLQVLNCD